MKKLLTNLDKRVYRIIDVNFNRTREGLRVCEEILRFILDDKKLTLKVKSIRHSIKDIVKLFPISLKELVIFRNSAGDIGKGSSRLEVIRRDFKDIFFANVQRSKESVRVLEEFTKLIDTKLSKKLKVIRYKIYSLEKEASEKF